MHFSPNPGRIVAEHPRRFGRGQTIYDPWHYVPVLARKPGALRNGAPFKDWVLPTALDRVRRKLAGSDDGDRPSPAPRPANCKIDVVISAGQAVGRTAITAAVAPGWIRWADLRSSTQNSPRAVRLNHPRRDLVRSIGVCPASPPNPWSSGGGAFLAVTFGQIFAYSAFSNSHFSSPEFGVRLDRVDRAFRLAHAAVNAFVRVDDEHVLAFVEAVHWAHVDAVHNFAANAALVDDVGQLNVPSADRSGELIHGIGPRGARSFAEKWTQRRPASSGSIGTPNSRHSRADRVGLSRYSQSRQIPKCRCSPLAATMVSTRRRAPCIAVCSSGSSESTARTRASNGSRAIASLPLSVNRRATLRPSASDRCRTK